MPSRALTLRWLVLALGSLLPALAEGAAPVSPAALAKAARAASLAVIDPSLASDDGGDRTIEAWLTALTRGKVRSIEWSGGDCRLVIPESPRDAGGADARCGRAVIRLAHPRNRSDRPEIEVYFNPPAAGRPLEAYAFRGAILGRDGFEYTRFTRDFEAVWRERFGTKWEVSRSWTDALQLPRRMPLRLALPFSTRASSLPPSTDPR